MTTYRDNLSSEVLDEEVQQLAKVAVQLNKEVLLANDFGQAFRPCSIAGNAREAIRVNPLCGQER